MKKSILPGFLGCIYILMSYTIVRAEEASWTDKIRLGVHLRVRNESNLNYDFDNDAGDKQNFTLLRARLNVDARANENVRVLIQPQVSRLFGDSALGSAAPFGPGNVPNGIAADDEGVALHQGFVDLSSGEITLRGGRQEMKFGDERLVGSLEWSNRSRSFDGANLIFDNETLNAQAFFFVVQSDGPAPAAANNSDTFFTGLHLTAKEVGNGVDAYYLVVLDSDGAPGSGDEALNIHTLGLCTKDMPKEGFGYDFEGVYQAGENGARRINAFAAHAALGFGLGGEPAPAVLVEYNVASGDDGGARDNAFKNLFPTNHNKYGFIDFMSWSNMHDIRGGVGVTPVENLRLAVDYHLFLAFKKNGAVGAGAAFLPAAARSDNLFGQEVDLFATYKWRNAAKFLGGYSIFFPGDMHAMDDPAHFLYVQAQVDI